MLSNHAQLTDFVLKQAVGTSPTHIAHITVALDKETGNLTQYWLIIELRDDNDDDEVFKNLLRKVKISSCFNYFY